MSKGVDCKVAPFRFSAHRMDSFPLALKNSTGLVSSGRRDGETATLVRDVDVPSVNTERIGALEALARTVSLDLNSREFGAKLATIEIAPLRYSIAQTSMAVTVACGAFAFLNGASWVEVAACWIGGGVGQGLKIC